MRLLIHKEKLVWFKWEMNGLRAELPLCYQVPLPGFALLPLLLGINHFPRPSFVLGEVQGLAGALLSVLEPHNHEKRDFFVFVFVVFPFFFVFPFFSYFLPAVDLKTR